MRRILGSLIGIAIVAAATAASAQTPAAKPAALKVTNATPGINIDVFLDAGKVTTVIVDPRGEAAFDLDLLSMGKPAAQLYIETCKDGQRLRVVSDGTTVPTDEGCNRKTVGVLFTVTCTGKITVNYAAAKASFAGCANFLTTPKFLGPAGGVLVLTGVAVSRDGGTSSSPTGSAAPTPGPATTASTAQPTIVVTPVVPAPPAAGPAPSAPAPNTPAPPAVGDPGTRQTVRSCSVTQDPGLHNAVLRFCEQVRETTISASNGGASVNAAAVWVMVGGSYSQTDGSFNWFRNGILSGTSFTAVDFRFQGTIDAQGNMSGTVTIGGVGLPGGQAMTVAISTVKP